jgi:arginyl-tRNA synthetase
LLHRFPEVVERATIEYEPHLVTNYLLQIASEFNSWYAQEQILDGTPAATHKVAITAAVARTLKNGLWTLGIPAPEKM